MMPTYVAVATTFLEGTLAGVHVGSALMEHAARRLSLPDWLAYNHAKGTVYGPTMPVFFGVTLVASIAAASILPDHVGQAIAATLLVAAGIITKVVNLPLNDEFESWSTASYPAGWTTLRARWQSWNLVRSAFVVMAFLATIWVAVASLPVSCR